MNRFKCAPGPEAYQRHSDFLLIGNFSRLTISSGQKLLCEMYDNCSEGLETLSSPPIESLIENSASYIDTLISYSDLTLRTQGFFRTIKDTFQNYKTGDATFKQSLKAVGSKIIYPDVPKGGFSELGDFIEYLKEGLLKFQAQTFVFSQFNLSSESIEDLSLRQSELCEELKISPQQLFTALVFGSCKLLLPEEMAKRPQGVETGFAKEELKQADFYLASKNLKKKEIEALQESLNEPFIEIDNLLLQVCRAKNTSDPRWGEDVMKTIDELAESISALRLSLIYFRRSFKYGVMLAQGHIPCNATSPQASEE